MGSGKKPTIAQRLPGIAALLPLLLVLATLTGCRQTHVAPTTQPHTSLLGLTSPAPLDTIEAIVAPPAGWEPEPLKRSDRHRHQVWLSPTGHTAFGVIRVNLPFPVGPDLSLAGFMREMRKSEGEGTLLEKEPDAKLPGLRFVAEGGVYRIRANLITHGWTCWVTYAGTLRDQELVESELQLAERAREATIVGLPR